MVTVDNMTNKIKICGLFRQEDIKAVNEAMPDYVGFVFAKSRRQVSAQWAMKLKEQLHPNIKAVGVFVNENPSLVIDIAGKHIIDMIQLHGQESEDDICYLKEQTGLPVIKAVSVQSAKDIEKFSDTNADYLLLDQGTGGTGKTFDWTQIIDCKKPYFLAGGISIENIDTAICQGAYAIDVSGGVETHGVKNKDKIIELVEKIHD